MIHTLADIYLSDMDTPGVEEAYKVAITSSNNISRDFVSADRRQTL